MKNNKVIIISGPTASGKTDFAISLGKKIDSQIINFDSLLFYKELNIGTAKPSQYEMEQCTHHMINTHSIATPINASDYAKLALPKVKEVLAKNQTPILVGGSGFYLQALLHGMYQSSTTPPEVLKKSENLYHSEGIEPFIDFLKVHDPESYKLYHQNDHYRIRRAVEHYWVNKTPFSKVRIEKESSKKNESNTHGWNLYFTYLDLPKDDHLKVIENRTKTMIENGLIDEVKTIIDSGFSIDLKPLKSIGYKEVVDYLNGIYKDIDDCTERINISTRQLAKSQRTWFKKIEKKEYNSLKEKTLFIENCINFIKG